MLPFKLNIIRRITMTIFANALATIMATQIVGWEEMNNNIVRVKTTDGHYIDLDVDIKAFDDAVMQLAGSSEPVDLTN